MILFNIWLFTTLLCVFYYIFLRIFIIFHWTPTNVTIFATILASCIILTFNYKWENKLIDFIKIINNWLIWLGWIIFLILLIEHFISIRYTINPRIIVLIVLLVLILWTFCSLHTKTKRLNIDTNKINKDIRILLVSDIHVDWILTTFHLNKIKKAIIKEKPNFVLIAWDLITQPNHQYTEYFSVLKSINNTPIYVVIWNHDAMCNKEIIADIQKKSGIVFLNNESTKYIYSKKDYIQIIGVVDKKLWWNRSISEILDKIKIENKKNVYTILISHRPIKLENFDNYPIDLEVAGHTHNWQFYGIRTRISLLNDYLYWKHEYHWKLAFVTQWIWTWRFLLFRLWTQSEMVIINLKKK